jgi:hypothetical protein
MRRWQTWLVVALVGTIAVLAAADALRGNGQANQPPSAGTTEETRARPPTLSEELRREDVDGLLVYSDEQCLLHSLLLPHLDDEVVRQEVSGAPVRHCTFSAGAGRFLADDEQVNAAGVHTARCRRGHVEVRDVANQRLVARMPGCTPAWRPDGALTYVRDGEVLVGGKPYLTRRDLHRAAKQHPNLNDLGAGIPFQARVTSLAWFDNRSLAATLKILVGGVEPQYLLVVLKGRRIVGSAVRFGGPFGPLLRSPAGAYVADEGGMVVDRDAVSTDLPAGIPSGRLVAFSPDQRWVAVVTRGSIYLVATPLNDSVVRILQLPFAAGDAVWEPAGPLVDVTARAG